MAGPKHRNASFPGFPDGVNNVFREDSVPSSQLRKAVNVDLLPDGKVRRRSGYLRRLELADGRSAASHLGKIYLADGPSLKRVDPSDFSEEVIGAVPANSYLSYASLNEFLYVAAGTTGYRIAPDGQVGYWSPEQPDGQPDVSSQSIGGLPGGEYQVAIVYSRSGEESGSARAQNITIPENGSIQISNIPQPERADTTAIRVYATHTNGEILYWARDLEPGTGATTLSALPSGKQLETQFMEPVPTGHIVRGFNGHLLSARDNVLYYSQALRFGLCNVTQDYFEFESRITMVRPVQSGIFVATERRTHFLSGSAPAEFVRATVQPNGAVEGTDINVPAGIFPFENLQTGEVAVWWSLSGNMVIGFPNGQVQILRDGELSLPEYARGTTMLRESNGVRQIVSTLQNPQTSEGAVAASDEAVVTVHRNGIEI
jgi:hypothetical protein